VGLMYFIASIIIVAIVISAIYCFFGIEEAPQWVEEDEYYRRRWYK